MVALSCIKSLLSNSRKSLVVPICIFFYENFIFKNSVFKIESLKNVGGKVNEQDYQNHRTVIEMDWRISVMRRF